VETGDAAHCGSNGVKALSPPEGAGPPCRGGKATFNELIRLLEANGFTLVKQKGSIRSCGKTG
jgi:hypothetical protein